MGRGDQPRRDMFVDRESAISPPPGEPARASALRWIVATFLAGSALQVWMILRSWVYFDQVLLLRLGLRWAVDHELVAWGKVMSGGGAIPGCALELAVGLPLSLWMDARSPLLFLFVSHLLAGVLLVRLLWRWVAADVALWFAVLYWLSPWRLFHGGFLWEPGYLLLPAAVALWAGFALRPGHPASRGPASNEPVSKGAVSKGAASRDPAARGVRIGASAALGASVTLAPQLHASGILLGAQTLLLLLPPARRIRPSWGGLVAGSSLGLLPLVPAARALAVGELPPWAPVEGRLFAGLIEVHPLLKSLTLWVRIASAETARRLLETVFVRDYGGRVDAAPPSELAWLWVGPLAAIAVASAVLVAVAQWRVMGPRSRIAPRARAGAAEEPVAWLIHGSKTALLVLLAATALSPVSPQMRYVLVFLHFACLPVALWLVRALPELGNRLRSAIVVLVLIRVPMALVLGFGHPMYRPPDDAAARARLSGEALQELELMPAPFGSGKERELPVGVR
ncbi:MAG TPA: hypothetical protein VMT85_02075 [Thermoanaerobaculia bacterium]|nr:hypothetical protein [Thermoanaerobaculia bacterium]